MQWLKFKQALMLGLGVIYEANRGYIDLRSATLIVLKRILPFIAYSRSNVVKKLSSCCPIPASGEHRDHTCNDSICNELGSWCENLGDTPPLDRML